MPDPNPAQPMLVFRLADHTYALPVAAIVEVATIVDVLPVPQSPPEVLGYANRQGEAMLMLDLRQVLGYAPCTITLSTFFIVLMGEQGKLGAVVDEIDQVRYFQAGRLNRATQSRLVEAVVSDTDAIIQILSPQKLLMTYTMEMPLHTQA